jgi:YidC/Oxa1 family membrane protein insertase
MEKRVALAIFLCFVVLVIYQAMLPKPAVVPAPASTPAGQAGAPATTPANPAPPPVAGAPATPAPGAPAVTTAPTAPAAAPLVSDTAAHDIVVDTDAIHAVFTTAGARLKSWQLKKYFNSAHQPLDLVPSDIPDTYARPFTLTTDDPALSATIANALYQPSTKDLTLGSSPGELSFDFKDSSGLSVHKTFHLQPEGKPYLLAVDAAIAVNGKSRPVVLSIGPGIGPGYSDDGSRDVGRSAVQMRADKVERLAANKLSEQSRFEGTQRFAGVEDQYFLSVVLPGEKPVRVDYQPVTLPVPNDPKGRSRTFVAYDVAVPNAASLTFFMGPKDLDILRAVDPQLVRVINFGFFALLVVPLLQALKWIHSLIGNYGWSIVVLTILINLLMFPLRHRSMVSMRKMQALQPQVKAIQERYKNYKMTDPEKGKMNQEMMALYKAKGVSPMSGCFPMLLTMPILYAFYSLLSASIELRGAPFMGWIHDLALKDPLYITPILMGATMFWQQRMMPSTADPVQQKMFLFMPLLFTVMFLAAPSGLVIYWLVSNIMAVGQQYMTNRMIGAPVPARAAAKPAPQKS